MSKEKKIRRTKSQGEKQRDLLRGRKRKTEQREKEREKELRPVCVGTPGQRIESITATADDFFFRAASINRFFLIGYSFKRK